MSFVHIMHVTCDDSTDMYDGRMMKAKRRKNVGFTVYSQTSMHNTLQNS